MTPNTVICRGVGRNVLRGFPVDRPAANARKNIWISQRSDSRSAIISLYYYHARHVRILQALSLMTNSKL